MIRFPKRNVAQPVPKKPKENFSVIPKEDKLIAQKTQNKLSCPGAIWNDKLYPSELWQMHDDLDKIAYGKLTIEERNEIYGRMRGSLLNAESDADKKLFDFVQETANTIGIEKYTYMLKQAMTPNTQLLLALRCYAAATSGSRIRDTITLYSNSSMNSIDFFPDSCRGTGIDPKTGKPFILVVDRPDNDDNPYWRSKNHSSARHRTINKITTDPEPTIRDKMPTTMAEQMANILNAANINVQSHEDAWAILSNMSRTTSIEERIVARIAYLIMNATVNSKVIGNQKLLRKIDRG